MSDAKTVRSQLSRVRRLFLLASSASELILCGNRDEHEVKLLLDILQAFKDGNLNKNNAQYLLMAPLEELLGKSLVSVRLKNELEKAGLTNLLTALQHSDEELGSLGLGRLSRRKLRELAERIGYESNESE
jgi:hypothetical protein